MARKKANVTTAPPVPAATGQVSIITLKGTAEYREWLVAESKRTRIPAASLVRAGLELWAKEAGVEPPPEK